MQERSRPVQPPQKPEAAPFFLPTLATLEKNPVFDTEAATPATEAETTANGLPGWGGEGDGTTPYFSPLKVFMPSVTHT